MNLSRSLPSYQKGICEDRGREEFLSGHSLTELLVIEYFSL